MERASDAALRVQRIEEEQDEILRQLEDLERRTQAVLAEHAPSAAQRPDIAAASDPLTAQGPMPTPETI